MVLATVVASRDSADANTFLPLTVDYKEKQFAYGQVPGMASRRESNMCVLRRWKAWAACVVVMIGRVNA